MKTYNYTKSEIFKAAWVLVKENGKTNYIQDCINITANNGHSNESWNAKKQLKNIIDNESALLMLLSGIVDSQFNSTDSLATLNSKIKDAKTYLEKIHS